MEIRYHLRLSIPYSKLKLTLDLFNHPETRKRLEIHCQKRCSGLKVPNKQNTIWSINPEDPYDNLEDAFQAWNIVNNVKIELRDEYIISGHYHFLLGEQEFLLETLSEVIDDCEIPVYHYNKLYCWWIVKDNKYLKMIF